MRRFVTLAAALSLAFAVTAIAEDKLAPEADGIKAPADKAGTVDFEKQIKPILKQNCYQCHSAKKQKGEFRLDKRAHLFPAEGSRKKWKVRPTDSDESDLYFVITLPADDPDVMPPEGDPLTPAQQDLIKKWIDEGAHMPASADEISHEFVEPKIDIPALNDAQKQAEQKAMATISNKGALAMKIAANTEAVDVNFSLLNSNVKDADLLDLKGLEPSLAWLNLARTGITDKGVMRLPAYGQLRRLHLENTAVTDAALPHVAKLSNLEYLNLYGTSVSNSGIAHLKKLTSLRKLYLWQTQVTDEGVEDLQKALPHLRIDIGKQPEVIVVDEPAPQAPAAAGKPINTVCPVSNKPVDAAKFVSYEGQVIGFCCDKCKAAFEAEPAKHIDKVKEFKKAEPQAGKPINAKCPLSGKDLNPEFVSVYEGKTIGFCCGNCKGSFDKDPAKMIEKVAEFKK